MLLLLASLALASPDAALAQLRGQPVAVVVAKGTWCPVCVDELRRLGHVPTGAVVGLFAEPEAKVEAAGASLPVPVVADPDHAWVERHGFTRPGLSHPLPGVLFLDRCGAPAGRLDGRSPGRSQASRIAAVLQALAERPCADEGVPNS